ncbi:NADPH-cytochrome P450 reductase [Nadsonia fulvescens var. elongata DSM 6958]|uniref:NADPH--cytochrome P450 reductase n=1 Tax=Nadsonia fulvescens var. elongata DSM 6958 TaxID=857566 RepID=A0A1E3PCU8_9ASCO|nr:NADPH-cytochrome P450 reductase [Nadsonia fulvescens var. elongata DSM 6958]
MASLDVLDVGVLTIILVGTVAYFTKGSLWGKPIQDPYLTSSTSSTSGDRDIVSKLESSGKTAVIFYGSQTGTAEDYAHRLSKEATARFGIKTMVADIEDYDLENLDTLGSDKVAAFVMSTYGEGEPTDNAASFYDFITSDSAVFSEGGDADSSPLSDLKYVIFGLGNNTYEHYNAIGRNLEKALQKMGAQRVGPYGEGDDGDGTTEEDFLAWKEEMFSDWKEKFDLKEREALYEASVALIEDSALSTESVGVYLGEPNKGHLTGNASPPYNGTNPYVCEITSTRELFKSDSRNCIHIEFNLGTSGIKYTTGDHIAVHPQNANEEVDLFLDILGLKEKRNTVFSLKSLDPTSKVPFPSPTTYDTIVRYRLEINGGAVSRQFISSVAQFAPNPESRKEALRLGGDKNAFANEITVKGLNIARALNLISNGEKWTEIPFTFVIETVQPLQPRYYSISSSSLVDKKTVSVTAVVESEKALGGDHYLKGVTTNLFLDIKYAQEGAKNTASHALSYDLNGPRGKFESRKLPIHIRHSNFKLPSNPSKPIILLGPGTGIAPFRGFVAEKAAQAKNGKPVGKTLLFFGSRNRTEDFLYEDEWNQHAETLGENFELVTAFSREESRKVYVQHRLYEKAAEINQLLRDGASFYVCGDASRMARDVQNTLVKIISEQRGIDITKAEAVVQNMKIQNNYQEDVW